MLTVRVICTKTVSVGIICNSPSTNHSLRSLYYRTSWSEVLVKMVEHTQSDCCDSVYTIVASLEESTPLSLQVRINTYITVYYLNKYIMGVQKFHSLLYMTYSYLYYYGGSVYYSMFSVLLCVCYLQSVEAVYRALEGVGEGVTGAKCVLCTQHTTLYNTAIEQLNTATLVRQYTSYYVLLRHIT